MLSEKIIKRFEGKNRILAYILLFNTYLILLSIPLYIVNQFSNVCTSLQESYTYFLSLLLDCYSKNCYVICGEREYFISIECIGLKGVIGLLSMIFSLPLIETREKLRYYIKWVWVVLFSNFIRIYISIILESLAIHNILWMLIQSLLLLAIWGNFLYKKKEYLKERINDLK